MKNKILNTQDDEDNNKKGKIIELMATEIKGQKLEIEQLRA